MSEVATAGDDGARETAMTDEQLVTFDLAILVRGINALKAARLRRGMGEGGVGVAGSRSLGRRPITRRRTIGGEATERPARTARHSVEEAYWRHSRAAPR
jgi:hypothetical protein